MCISTNENPLIYENATIYKLNVFYCAVCMNLLLQKDYADMGGYRQINLILKNN